MDARLGPGPEQTRCLAELCRVHEEGGVTQLTSSGQHPLRLILSDEVGSGVAWFYGHCGRFGRTTGFWHAVW